MDRININITSNYVGKTIKEFLKENNIGRGKVESIRVNKQAMINDVICSLETKLSLNDCVSFIIDEEVDFVPLKETLEVVYEDDYILIVNKPSNMIIHPDDKSKSGTLANLVANYYKENKINRKVRYIHRIDKETTGIVVFAKDFISEARLLKDLENNKLVRSYLAFVEGKIKNKKGTINAPIGQDRHINNKMCVSSTGKNAITHYQVIEEYDDFTLVKFELETGRTHQIRVHAKHINHPLLGDVVYGGNYQYINRVALHSYEVILTHPITKKELKINCDLPSDIKKIKKVK